MTDEVTYTQWGRQTPDGNVLWQSEDGWTPPWSIPEGRVAEQANYNKQLQSLGIPSEQVAALVFLRREMQITYTEATPIIESKVSGEDHPGESLEGGVGE